MNETRKVNGYGQVRETEKNTNWVYANLVNADVLTFCYLVAYCSAVISLL